MVSLNCPEWINPPDILELPGENVHIWRVGLALSISTLQELAQTLSPDESQRAARFRFDRDRDRFIGGRGSLRAILSRYLKTNPAELRFCYGSSGKPALKHSSGNLTLEFNLAHSQDLMLCAIAQNARIGIDLEYLRPVSDLKQLTHRFFAAQEHRAIQALPIDQQLPFFFQHWTCKEAVLKAVGEGLADLSEVEVAITDSRVDLVRWVEKSPFVDAWRIELFSPAPNYTAAIAVNDHYPTEASGSQNAPPANRSFVFWQYAGDK